jgi:IS605 OrfB family transposase
MQTQRTITILLPDDPDLRQTLLAYRSVQQTLSSVCYNEGRPLAAIRLQEVMYHQVKGQLSAQMTCSVIRCVAGAYKSARINGRPAKRPFRFEQPTALFLIGCRGRDAKILPDHQVSIWTTAGRKVLPFTLPAYFQERFEEAIEFDSLLVIERKGRLVGKLVITLDVPEPVGDQPCGIDRGELNAIAAVDSNNQTFFRSGTRYRQKNKASYKQRKRLQKRLELRKAEGKDTRSVRRALKRLGSKSANRSKDFVRTTAKRLVDSLPKDSVLVLEDLWTIPQPLRTKTDREGNLLQQGNRRSRSLRRRLSGWQYGRLQQALLSIAQLRGIPVVLVSAAYTSLTCHGCGERGVRKRHLFVCHHCGLCCHADVNAAVNIRNRFGGFAVYLHGGRNVSAPCSPVALASASNDEGKLAPLGVSH